MIEKMEKVYLVTRAADRERLLQLLSEWAVLHLKPVAPDSLVADEKCRTGIDRLARTLQLLEPLAGTGSGTAPAIEPLAAAEEALRLHREEAELITRLNILHQQVEQLRLWGDVRLEQFEQLREQGIDIKFFTVPADQLAEVHAECVQHISDLPGKRVLVAVIDRSQTKEQTEGMELPELAERVPLPANDMPSLRTEAAEIDRTLKGNKQRLVELAQLMPRLREKLTELKNQAEFTMATSGGLSDESLFAVQGWMPVVRAKKLTEQIAQADIGIAYQNQPVEPGEEPPTSIGYPAWARPIKGLFDILGTLPGYEEVDLAPFFMIALPVFSAMLIGDAGYGLIFMIPPLILYRKMSAAAGPEKTQLLIFIGACTLIWGILTANIFGITPVEIAKVGGFVHSVNGTETADIAAMQAGSGGWASIGKTMVALAPCWDIDSEKARNIFIKISLLCGCLHLILARLRRTVAFFPDIRFLAEIGWCLFLMGMQGVIWLLFFGAESLPVSIGLIYAALIAGACLFILFTAPSRN
ncbi:MAG: hypothetical protein KAJ52_00495, partial [Sedimentisphaerales bacterium]|nr:hypothetical protein [Sedimentisphaerales bacterium]